MDRDETLEREPRTGERPASDEAEEFKVEDRRHWTHDEDEDEAEPEDEVAPRQPTVIDEYRQRAEAAEAKLHEYIAAFKSHREEQDRLRERLAADVDRRVDLKFGELVGELLGTVDDLNLGLSHVEGVAEAKPLAEGVTLARDRFLATLERHGIQEIVPDRKPFDPNEAEATRVDPVDSSEMDGMVTETLQTGYRLGERVIRAARVAVGRYVETGSESAS